MLCLSGLGLPDSRDAKLLCGSFGAGGEDTAVCYMTVLGLGIEDTGACYVAIVGPGGEDTGSVMWQFWCRGVRIRVSVMSQFGSRWVRIRDFVTWLRSKTYAPPPSPQRNGLRIGLRG